MSNSTVIAIEGIIGCGKTTLMGKLKEIFKNEGNIYFFDEPLESFQTYELFDGNKINPLDLYYKDIKLNAFAFQMFVLRCYDRLLEKIATTIPKDKHSFIVMDRSIYSARVFCEVLFENNYISSFALDLYEKFVSEVIRKYYDFSKPLGVDKIFYMKLPVDFCVINLKKRSRSCEVETSENMKEYQLVLENKYDKFLQKLIVDNGLESVVYATSTNFEETVRKACDFIRKTVKHPLK